jgi:hypothetical protein
MVGAAVVDHEEFQLPLHGGVEDPLDDRAERPGLVVDGHQHRQLHVALFPSPILIEQSALREGT